MTEAENETLHTTALKAALKYIDMIRCDVDLTALGKARENLDKLRAECGREFMRYD